MNKKLTEEIEPLQKTKEQKRSSSLFNLSLALIGIATIIFFCWQWYDARSKMSNLQYEVARRLTDTENYSRESQLLSKQAQEATRELQIKIGILENKLNDSQSQRLALEALYQELSRNRDEWVLAEIEQILTIAAQQLQLAGNVQAALTALQIADSRLARMDRPQFIPIRKILSRDIERLRSLPYVDSTGISLRLDNLMAQLETLPLVFDMTEMSPKSDNMVTGKEGLWGWLKTDLLGELKQLVRIKNIQKPEAALLSPTQSFFLRENLKLRLLNARLALLQRDQAVFREDVQTVQSWLERYFDIQAKATQAFIIDLRQLAAAPISVPLPDLKDSLDAVRNYKISRNK